MKERRCWLLVVIPAVCISVPVETSGSQPATASQSDASGLAPVGLARIDITPEEPIRLTGYRIRRAESKGVAGKLWAKALAIGSDLQGPALLITVDVIGVPQSMTDELARRLKAKAGFDRAQLAVCASHTHCGPVIQGVLPLIFGEPVPAEQQRKIDRYAVGLLDRLERVALDALTARQPGRIAWAQGGVGFAANRRRVKGAVPVDAPYGREPVDHALPLLEITDAGGRLRVVVVGYACHCTTLPAEFNQAHGDWAGVAQQVLETMYPNAMAMVVIGCGADANPRPRLKMEHVVEHGQAVASEVKRLLAGKLRPLALPPSCRWRQIDLPLDTIPAREEWERRAQGNDRAAYHARIVLQRLDRGERLPTAISYPVQTWSFGDDLSIVFLAGEVVVDYALRLKSELAGDRLWITAYANDLPCYIASRRVIAEGGYEAGESMCSYDKPASLSPAVDDLIVDTVGTLLPRAFHRQVPGASPVGPARRPTPTWPTTWVPSRPPLPTSSRRRDIFRAWPAGGWKRATNTSRSRMPGSTSTSSGSNRTTTAPI